MKLQLLKCHGSSNNFILIDEYEKILFSEEERVTLSKSLCETEQVDGILFFQNSKVADGKMRMFNPDGSEAEMCGNGLRCIGRFACETLDKTSVLIETLKSVSTVSKDKNIYKTIETYQAELKNVLLNTKNIPILLKSETLINQPLSALSSNLDFTAVSMPNPHIVSIVDKVSDSELIEVGEKANALPMLFPNGVNVNFCQILDEGVIFVRTYERGVGLTKSCGSGMSASSMVYCLLGYSAFGKTIDVYNQGGLVRCKPVVTAFHQYSVFLSGNATFVFKSIKDEEIKICENIFVNEIQDYGQLLEYSENMLEGLV